MTTASGRLTDRVVIVTGGAQGLGQAYARHLAAAGARVVIADLDGDRAAATSEQIGPAALPVRTDVTDSDDVASMVEQVIGRWGRIDGLVNNAGGAMYPTAPAQTIGRQQFDHVIAVNLTAQWVCSSAVYGHMQAARYGKIVNICSSSFFLGGPAGLAPYIAAKGGALGLTRALAREWGADNICVNAVSPGWVPVDTPKVVHDPAAAQRLSARVTAEQCLPRVGTPQDLCGTIEYLCSADSDFVTGQVINVDGGWTQH